jgi:hypothetical protein
MIEWKAKFQLDVIENNVTIPPSAEVDGPPEIHPWIPKKSVFGLDFWCWTNENMTYK